MHLELNLVYLPTVTLSTSSDELQPTSPPGSSSLEILSQSSNNLQVPISNEYEEDKTNNNDSIPDPPIFIRIISKDENKNNSDQSLVNSKRTDSIKNEINKIQANSPLIASDFLTVTNETHNVQ